MLKFRTELRRIRLKRGQMSNAFIEGMKIQMRQGAREWLRQTMIRIPVWSGMARGSLKFAKGRQGDESGAFLFDYLHVAVPIGSTKTSDGSPIEIRNDKSPEIGGRKARFAFGFSDGKFTFSYSNSIGYVAENDAHSTAETSGWPRPWMAFAAGQQAYRDYMNAHAKDHVPNLKEFLVWEKLDV